MTDVYDTHKNSLFFFSCHFLTPSLLQSLEEVYGPKTFTFASVDKMEERHENRAQRGHDGYRDANDTHKSHILNPKNANCDQDYWRKVSEPCDHQAVDEHLDGPLLLQVSSVGVRCDESIKDKGITYPHHNNGYYKWDYCPEGEIKCVKNKINCGKRKRPNPDKDHHHNPRGYTLGVVVGDWMNHSKVTVEAAAGHQQGSSRHIQGKNTIPKGLYWPILPDQVI